MKVKIRKIAVSGPSEIARVLKAVLEHECEVDQCKEHVWTVGFNTRNVIQYVELVSLGTLNASLVHPRETFRYAVMKGISALAVVHNHPSGSLEPSDDDVNLANRLTEAGRILGIEVLDHVIIANDTDLFYSFKEHARI
jgi:DNA repair protein RadC